MKVLLANAIGAAIIAGAFVFYQEYSHARIVADVSREVQMALAMAPKTTFVVVPDTDLSDLVKASTSLHGKMPLRSDEVCVNGETVTVSHSFDVGHEYRDGKPLKCIERSKFE